MENQKNKLWKFLIEIIKDILIFGATIFIYGIILALIFPDLEFVNTRLESVKNFIKFIFIGEIFNYPKFFGIFIIFIGIPAIIIRRICNHLSNKLNLILMPLVIIITSLFILPLFYILFFNINELSLKLEKMLNFYIITSTIFQIIYSFIIATLLIITRKNKKILNL